MTSASPTFADRTPAATSTALSCEDLRFRIEAPPCAVEQCPDCTEEGCVGAICEDRGMEDRRDAAGNGPFTQQGTESTNGATPTPLTFKDRALALIALNIPVIPCQPLAKHTYLKGGPERGTVDPVVIAAWNVENPAYNVGCLGTLDNLALFDCDVKGLVSQIEKQTGHKMPPTFTVKSANKGTAHLYFKQTERSRALGNAVHRAGEVRGNNEYLVGPGSVIVCDDGSTRAYEIWRNVPFADFPDWLVDWVIANPASSVRNAQTGETEGDVFSKLKEIYHQNLDPEEWFGRKDIPTITSLHPMLTSLGALLHDGERTVDEIAELLDRVGREYGHRDPLPKDTRDVAEWVVKREPCDLEPIDLPPVWVYSAQKPGSQDGCLWCFSTEEAYAVFKNRCEQTPAWAFEYCPGTDPDFFGPGAILNTDYEAWKATRGATDVGWRLVSYSDITATKVDWLWKGYLATGKLTMINGEPGSGKSLITLDIAARVTTGRDWSDGSKNLRPPSAVLLLTEEEDAGDTIKPRFLAAGGNPDYLITLNVGKAGLFQIETDTDRLRKAIQSAELPIRLVILDPVADYTSVDAYKDAEVRPMLNKLREFGAEIGAAVIGVNHLNKKTDLGPIHRVSGARGWVSFARLNFLVGVKDNSRHVVPLKTNIAKDGGSLTFTIGSESVTDGDIVVDEVAKVLWQPKGTLTAADLMATTKSPKDTETSELEACLRKLLSGKTWYSAAWVIQEADLRGWTKRSVQRMGEKLGVERRWTHDAPPKREWRMPPRPTEPDEALNDFNPGIASPGEKGEVNV
jgi:putative DNA primase/helicase